MEAPHHESVERHETVVLKLKPLPTAEEVTRRNFDAPISNSDMGELTNLRVDLSKVEKE